MDKDVIPTYNVNSKFIDDDGKIGHVTSIKKNSTFGNWLYTICYGNFRTIHSKKSLVSHGYVLM